MCRYLLNALLAVLLFQLGWSVVAPYIEHETQACVGHCGHHDINQRSSASGDAELVAEVVVSLASTPDASSDATHGMADLDCWDCHSSMNAMLSLSQSVIDVLSTAPPDAAFEEAVAAHEPAQPERPQWLRLA